MSKFGMIFGAAIAALTTSAIAKASWMDLNISSSFDSDVLANASDGTPGTLDGAPDPLDPRSGNLRSALTVSGALASGATALQATPNFPDNGFFPMGVSGNTMTFDVQLGYSNNDNGVNAIRLTETEAGTPVNIGLLPAQQGQYNNFFLFLTAAEGDQLFNFALNYSDASSSTFTNITATDWFNDPAPAGHLYLIDGMDRTSNGPSGFSSQNDSAVFAIPFTPDSSKTLVSFSITKLSNLAASGDTITVFGASAFAVPEPTSLSLCGIGFLWLMRSRIRKRSV